jgi:hypothetical protein
LQQLHDLSQNQVVATSCWFESGQGHQSFFKLLIFCEHLGDVEAPDQKVGRSSGCRRVQAQRGATPAARGTEAGLARETVLLSLRQYRLGLREPR